MVREIRVECGSTRRRVVSTHVMCVSHLHATPTHREQLYFVSRSYTSTPVQHPLLLLRSSVSNRKCEHAAGRHSGQTVNERTPFLLNPLTDLPQQQIRAPSQRQQGSPPNPSLPSRLLPPCHVELCVHSAAITFVEIQTMNACNYIRYNGTG